MTEINDKIISGAEDKGASSDSPDRIMRDLLKTEKEIASESLLLLKQRYEKEKLYWENLLQEKQRLILELQKSMGDSDVKIKNLQMQLDGETQKQIDQLRITSREIEARKLSETKKWQAVEDEIRSFRSVAADAQNKLISERERIIELKRNFEYNEKLFNEQLNSKEEEIMQHKELSLKREDAYLRDKSLKDEELALLQDQLKSINDILASERQYNAKIQEEKDRNIFDLQKGLQNAIVQLTTERQSNDKLDAKAAELQKVIETIQDDNKNLRQTFDEERLSLQRTVKEEQSNLEKQKQEFQSKEEIFRKETGEQLSRLAKSGEILEQQLTEEQRLRKSAESKLLQKESELQQILRQNEEIASDWKKIIAAERDTWQKRQSDITAEYERFKQAKEEEITKLHQKNNAYLSEMENNRKFHFSKKRKKPKTPPPAGSNP
ncbi:MAG: hypothetical protein ABII64_11090 [Elusimicrobiota bacterium]